MASVLLACGFGVASLIGSPHVPYVAQITEHGPTANSLQRHDLPHGRKAGGAPGGVRLLPEVAAIQIPIQSDALQPGSAPSPYPTTTFAPLDAAHLLNTFPAETTVFAANKYVTRLPNPIELATPSAEMASGSPPGLHARLRDTRPRPVRPADGNDLLITEPARTTPVQAAAVASLPYLAPIAPAPRSGPAEIVASYSAPSKSDNSYPHTARLAPVPPLPVAAMAPPRIHRIIDGDTLPKIAQRYLRDARRSDEIFSLNRDVLSNPDLLPIGAELKVPAITAVDRGG